MGMIGFDVDRPPAAELVFESTSEFVAETGVSNLLRRTDSREIWMCTNPSKTALEVQQARRRDQITEPTTGRSEIVRQVGERCPAAHISGTARLGIDGTAQIP